MKINREIVDPKFLYYLLQTLHRNGYMAVFNIQHTGVSRFQYTCFKKKTFLSIPKRNVQFRISNILSAYDDLIENNKRRIAILEKMAEEIYREWFVRMRFPSDGKDQKVPRKVGGLPPGWSVKRLGELVSDILDYRGVTPTKLGYSWDHSGEGVIALSALNVKHGELIKLDQAKRVSAALYQRWMRKKLKRFDILLTSEAPLGQVYLLLNETEYVLSQRLFALRAEPSRIDPTFLYHYLRYETGQAQLCSRATGSTVGGIRQSLLRKVDVIVPPKELLQRYSMLVLPILEHCSALARANVILAETKDMVLPRLVSGKLSVQELNSQSLVHKDLSEKELNLLELAHA